MSTSEIEILNDVVRMVNNYFGNRSDVVYYEDEQLM